MASWNPPCHVPRSKCDGASESESGRSWERERAAGKAAERGREFYLGAGASEFGNGEGETKLRGSPDCRLGSMKPALPGNTMILIRYQICNSNFPHQSNYLNYARATHLTAGGRAYER